MAKQYYAVRNKFKWKLTEGKVEDGLQAWVSAGFTFSEPITPEQTRRMRRLAEHGRVDRGPERYTREREIIPFGPNKRDATRALEPLEIAAREAQQLHRQADPATPREHTDMMIDYRLEETVKPAVEKFNKVMRETEGTEIEKVAQAIDWTAREVFTARKTYWLYDALKSEIERDGHEAAIEKFLRHNHPRAVHPSTGGIQQEKECSEQQVTIEFLALLRSCQAAFKRQHEAAEKLEALRALAEGRRACKQKKLLRAGTAHTEEEIERAERFAADS